ncbi:MAG: thiolase family protein [Elusimicrobia bacterium]|nr:thiolase family protein [Elusimicrobiota bacterium]
MPTRNVVVLAGARTPFTEWAGGKTGGGAPGGALKDLSAIELGAIALRGALEKAGVPGEDVDHVVFGNALQTSPDAIYGARHVALKAGVPVEVPALTVSRICGSGLQAAVTAAQHIRLGEARVVACGGIENLSQAPFVVRGLRHGLKLRHLEFEDYFLAALSDPVCGLMMAQTAEHVARKYRVSRQEQDVYALRSHNTTAKAAQAGIFKEEIVPVQTKGGRIIAEDDHFVSDCTLEGLSKLQPYFSKDGFVTAGNASGLTDGACALILASEDEAAAKRVRPLGRILSWGVAGVPPEEMGMGPVPAVRKALDAAGVGIRDVDLFEVNEAFAAAYIAVEKALGIDRDKANVNGGAIGIGHPLGATGARQILTVLLELRRRKKRLGIATACIGGGQGMAVLLEALT